MNTFEEHQKYATEEFAKAVDKFTDSMGWVDKSPRYFVEKYNDEYLDFKVVDSSSEDEPVAFFFTEEHAQSFADMLNGAI